MNRKQKKAKRLRATAHTKHRCEVKQERDHSVVFNRQSAEACLAQRDEFNAVVLEVGKKKFKAKQPWLFVALLVFIVWWIYNVNS
ncbi:hypothetical protein G9F32_03050 [Acinetobacter sp. 194]|uniref:hypothetical protein n=1 Tax=Acinetobacter shaoyimingii TaxID=2715164 RepID=UPI00140AAC37|nr:hypothetical protein [Acinetobacter shaoyimingii]NHB57010.1 hypothetical protein [Acinetobacter shaoyimingii]